MTQSHRKVAGSLFAAALFLVSTPLFAALPLRAIARIPHPAVVKAPPCVADVTAGQPTSQPLWIPVNSSSTLAVDVTGSGPIDVAWVTDDGVPVGSGPNLPVTPLTTTCYHAIVSNGCQTVTSADVWVMISTPAITEDATVSPATIDAGQTATLEAGGGTGLGPFTYKWFTSDGTLAGKGKKLVVRPAVTTSYYYKLCNTWESGASNTVSVTVK